jgi:Flp pilus assembly CpaE family ATPase
VNREGVQIPDEMELRRTREIVDELRRRRGERERPPLELDYLDRLLDQF